MMQAELRSQVALGEDSRRQLGRDVTNAESLDAEMAAFANSEGGTIFLGVADDGSTPGLSRADVLRINPMIGCSGGRRPSVQGAGSDLSDIA